MSKDLRAMQLRQVIAQQAARMMVEDGVNDFAYAKKKAGRQVGVTDAFCLPSNSEIEEEIRLYQALYMSDEQPTMLRQMREDALKVMQLFERFKPHLSGPVLDGTAGQYAETHIHLFADSAKEVEIFLLNQQIPYQSGDKSFRVRERSNKDKKNNERLKVPTFTLEGPMGLIKLSVFEYDDMRFATKHPAHGQNADRLDIQGLQALLQQAA
jgi:hypothetical protein